MLDSRQVVLSGSLAAEQAERKGCATELTAAGKSLGSDFTHPAETCGQSLGTGRLP